MVMYHIIPDNTNLLYGSETPESQKNKKQEAMYGWATSAGNTMILKK
jgi:hypothetical protein